MIDETDPCKLKTNYEEFNKNYIALKGDVDLLVGQNNDKMFTHKKTPQDKYNYKIKIDNNIVTQSILVEVLEGFELEWREIPFEDKSYVELENFKRILNQNGCEYKKAVAKIEEYKSTYGAILKIDKSPSAKPIFDFKKKYNSNKYYYNDEYIACELIELWETYIAERDKATAYLKTQKGRTVINYYFGEPIDVKIIVENGSLKFIIEGNHGENAKTLSFLNDLVKDFKEAEELNNLKDEIRDLAEQNKGKVFDFNFQHKIKVDLKGEITLHQSDGIISSFDAISDDKLETLKTGLSSTGCDYVKAKKKVKEYTNLYPDTGPDRSSPSYLAIKMFRSDYNDDDVKACEELELWEVYIAERKRVTDYLITQKGKKATYTYGEVVYKVKIKVKNGKLNLKLKLKLIPTNPYPLELLKQLEESLKKK